MANNLGWDDTIRPSRHTILSSNINKLSLSPENKRKRRLDDIQPHIPKRSRKSVSTNKTKLNPAISLKRRLDALTHQQLVSLVENLVEEHEEVAEKVDFLVPHLTVEQSINVLKNLLNEIKTHIPLGDMNGDYAFLRVKPFYTSFFVALADYTFMFINLQDLQRVLEFLDLATNLVHEIPRWKSQNNNMLLKRAYCELQRAWTKSLKEANQHPFGMLGAAWEVKFNKHCERSNGGMLNEHESECKRELSARLESVSKECEHFVH